MIFYEMEATIGNLEDFPAYDEEHRKPFGIDPDELKNLSQKLRKDDNVTFLFVYLITRDGVIHCAAIAESKAEFLKQWGIFLQGITLQTKNHQFHEVTSHDMDGFLNTAQRKRYIDEDIYLMERACGINVTNYEEDLLSAITSYGDLRDMARSVGLGDSLVPEIDRIEQGAAIPDALGHPVHYLIQGRDADVRSETVKIILQALSLAQRIENQRFTTQELEDFHYSPNKIPKLFFLNQGGALVLDCRQDEGSDDEFIGEYDETLIEFCESLQNWRNRTLMFFLVSSEESSYKKLIKENMEHVSLVEIKEETVYGDAARKVLGYYVKSAGYQDESLVSELVIDYEKGYLPSELKEMFDEWQDNYLKEDVYPQYGRFISGAKWKRDKRPEGNAIIELDDMIGLTEVKDVIRQALDFYKARDLFEKKGLSEERPAMHMVFTGNPGTAKTSVARLFTQIMKENGVLSNGKLHEVGRADLVGKYVGWTAHIVKQKFKAARGGVLFIDEAYSLVDDRSGMYGDEAINTIVQEMENCRSDTIVIFAGYPDEMETFLARNPGLRSRIAFHVPFTDYNADELYAITKLLAKQKGLKLARGVKKKLVTMYDGMIGQKDFGNGRYARNILEKAILRQASRLVNMDELVITKEDVSTLRAEDFEQPEKMEQKTLRQIGFLASWD